MIFKFLTVVAVLSAIFYIFWLTFVGIRRTRPEKKDESENKEDPKNK